MEPDYKAMYEKLVDENEHLRLDMVRFRHALEEKVSHLRVHASRLIPRVTAENFYGFLLADVVVFSVFCAILQVWKNYD